MTGLGWVGAAVSLAIGLGAAAPRVGIASAADTDAAPATSGDPVPPDPARSGPAGSITIGSKNFDENKLLAEMFARLIESRTGLTVERSLGLAGTQICFDALRSGDIDVYPEYTGTGLVTILGDAPSTDGVATLNRVRSAFLAEWNLYWLAPLGFENAYEIAVPRDLAERDGLATISDLVPIAPELTAAFGYEFITRDDGLPGLEAHYGLSFGSVRGMQQALKYQAAGAREIDCLDVYTTDGRLVVNDLVVLEDDLSFFPPYEACALVRGSALEAYPEIAAALGLLAGALDADAMRALNLRVEHGGEAIEVVAQDALETLGLVGARDVDAVTTRDRGFWSYVWANRDALWHRVIEHLGLTVIALGLGVVVAVPIGLALERNRRMAEPVIRAIGITQTVPSLALLAFMIPLLGIGAPPAITALFVYSLFPMVRNTFSGVRDASPSAVTAASALGMTARQVLLHVRLPLAAPIIMAGVRTAAVITVGTATLAAFIGAGGLGEPIISGLQSNDTTEILSGAVPAAALALSVDGVLALVERHLTPRGLG